LGGVVSFNDQLVGTSSGLLSVTLTSTGTAALRIDSIAITGPDAADFAIVEGGGGGTLGPGESRTIRIRFTPTTPGPHSASLTVSDNAPGSPHSVALSGIGKRGPALSISPGSLSF